jgi:ABC-type multidrug transport system fused ATPase/permease subunit|tara:strand:+ start:16078 stop:17715 length:1638 start_codon:yes stop_codon:yes gene_type:complete
MHKGKEDRNILVWLISFTKPFKLWIGIAFFTMIIVAAFELLIPINIKNVVDGIVESKSSFDQIKEYSFEILLLIFGVFIFSSTFSYILNITGQKIMRNIRDNVFDHVLKLPQDFFDKQSVGRVTTRVTNDVNALNEFYTNVLVQFLKDILVIIGVVYVMFKYNASLTFMMIGIIISIIFFAFLYRKRLRRVYTALRLTISKLNSFINESIRGINLLKIYNKKDNNFQRFEKLSKENFDANMEQMYTFAIFRPFIEFMSVFSTAAIIWFGGQQIIDGNLSIGQLLAILFFLRMIFRPILDLADKYNILQSALAASENLYEIIKIKTEQYGNIKFPNNFKSIKFDNVSFAYNDENWVLKDFNLEIKNGDSLLLLGSTGSGKTTIINLLLGFYSAQKGEIFIDGIPLNHYDFHSIRRNFSVIMQDTPLFNIVLDDENINNVDAIRSVGEKQIKNVKQTLEKPFHIIILDEATSNLDLDLEKDVKDYLEGVKSKTSILIAHRLNLIRDEDKILILNNGKLVETGNHKDLIKLDKEYSKIFKYNQEFFQV